MKNVLIITGVFPPMPEIGGVRLYGLAKYLPRFGWNPIILTRTLPADPDSTIQVIQTPYHDVGAQWKKRLGLNPNESLNTQFQIKTRKNRSSIVDRLAFIPTEIITYPDGHIGWYNYGIDVGNKIIQNEQIDAIISSSPPITTHLIAKTLSEKYKIPWIADFRDLWTQNHYHTHTKIRQYFEKKLELKTLSQASAITTTTRPFADKLSELHKNKPIYSIPNGFDPDIINPGIDLDNRFLIIYTGILYQGKRDPLLLFKTIKDLLNKSIINQDILKIDFFGQPEDWLLDEINQYELQNIVTLRGQLQHDSVINEQRKAQLLLLLTWDHPEERRVCPGKMFEYLAARRPILSIGNPNGGVVNDLLKQTNAGVHIQTDAELWEYLFNAYQEYKELGAVQYHGIEAEIMKFSHFEMAKKFADVMKETTESG